MTKIQVVTVGISMTLAIFAVVVFTLLPQKIQEEMVSWTELVPATPREIPLTEASMLFIGDIMLSRHVETLAERSPLGFDRHFTEVTPFFSEFDLVVANLEGPIPVVHQKTPDFSTRFSFKREAIEGLDRSGVDIVSLANNHTFDFGEDDFTNTKTVLDEVGIEQFGHPIDPALGEVYVTELAGQSVAFVGLHDATVRLDIEKALEVISAQSELHDLVIVSIHWGTEYMTTSNDRQKSLAHAFIDNGADLIIGHHPHVRQESEEYNGKMIYYSLGNFLFDQYFSTETQRGLGVELTIDSDGGFATTKHEFNLSQSLPRLCTGAEESPCK